MFLNPRIKMNDKCCFVFVKSAADHSMSLPFGVWMYSLTPPFSILYHDTHEVKREFCACPHGTAEGESELNDPLEYASLNCNSEVCYPDPHFMCFIRIGASDSSRLPRQNSKHRVGFWHTCFVALCLEFLDCTVYMSVFSILQHRRCGAQSDPMNEHESCPFSSFKCVSMHAHSLRDRKHDLDSDERDWRSCLLNISRVFVAVIERKTNFHPSYTQA